MTICSVVLLDTSSLPCGTSLHANLSLSASHPSDDNRFSVAANLIAVTCKSVVLKALIESHKQSLHQPLNTESLQAYYNSEQLHIGKHEFCLSKMMLLRLGTIQEADVEVWIR